MRHVLEVFTFQAGYMGGVATMVKSYLDGVSEFAQEGFILHNLNVPSRIRTGWSILDNLAYIITQRLDVRKHLGINSYDIIHIHTSREFLFLKDVLLAKLIKKEFNIPVVMTIHVGALETVFNRISWLKKYSLTILNKNVSKVIFLSKVMRDDFCGIGLNENRTTVLYNFYNFIPVPDEEIFFYESKIKLLYVGAIHREKGIIELLEALKDLSNLDYQLNVCGQLTDPTIKDVIKELTDQLGEKVSFLGYVSGIDKTKLYHESDLLILPSYHEGLPLVIMEALGAGCAIMTTRVGAIPEILTDENCLWVDVASTESIVQQLKNITKEDVSNMKKFNKKRGDDFSFVQHVKALCNIYRSVL